jgi:hypothetical protein
MFSIRNKTGIFKIDDHEKPEAFDPYFRICIFLFIMHSCNRATVDKRNAGI